MIRKLFFVAMIFWQTFAGAQERNRYLQEINSWDKARAAYLLSPDGWVNLEGLFWLKPGKNSFGRDAANDIVFTNASFPKQAGFFEWVNGQVSWVTNKEVVVSIRDTPISHALIFEEGKQTPLLASGSFRWNIIKRDDKIGIRFRNLASPSLKKFKGINRYGVNVKWRVTAHLEKAPGSNIFIKNVLGQTDAMSSPGKLVFNIGKETYTLDALVEDEQLFILFGDATSGKETYPTGRFLYAKLPDEKGNTILDFNKSFNPPCAFTSFATCPLPPKQNILPIAVTAGEKEYAPDGKKHAHKSD